MFKKHIVGFLVSRLKDWEVQCASIGEAGKGVRDNNIKVFHDVHKPVIM